MNKKWFFISLFGLLLLFAIVACAQSTSAPEVETLTDAEIEQLIVDKCGTCHSSDRVFAASYDAEGWVDVFEDMIDKGADVSSDEQEMMIDWLVNQ